jgi:PHD/YefM family antitoxin component YafN of YafNO toxin-antitoxin module
MNANIVMTSADDFQLLQRELAVAARSQSLARAEATARAMNRVLDKAATLAALNKRLRRK